jgi:roadblock/LC7 domain-containing protein
MEMEQMMARLLAKMRTNQEMLINIEAKANTNLRKQRLK